jgi:hypothetical protein
MSRSLCPPVQEDTDLSAELIDALAGSAHLVYETHDRHPADVDDFESLPESEKALWRKVATIVATLTAAHYAEHADRHGAGEAASDHGRDTASDEIAWQAPPFAFSMVPK